MDAPIPVPVAEWRPDLPPLAGGAASVSNVLPRTAESYGPFPNLAPYATSPLPLRCQGACDGLDPAGAVHVIAGTATNLYGMTAASPVFSAISKSASPYNLSGDEMWRFTTVKDRICAANIADPIQSFRMGTDSTFSDLSSAAPKARYVAGVKSWLFAANTNDPVGGLAPWRLWWSGINDATNWPQPGTAAAQAAQSDYNDTVGEGGWIQGLVGNLGQADVGIFFEHAVWRGFYVGGTVVFDFAQASGVKGTPAPASIVQLGGGAYYLGEDGFYFFDGAQATPIGLQKVDKTFFADLDQAFLFRIVGAVDPINKLVMWAYPGAGHNQGNPNKIIIYHWVLERWTIATIDTEYLFRSQSFGYNMDTLDSTGYNMDTLPFSLDSRAWTGGGTILSGFDLTHTLGYFSGSNLAASVDTAEIQPFTGQRTFVRNTRPLVDGGSPSVALGTRELLTSSKSFASPMAMNSLGWCPQRTSTRYLTGRVSLPAASTFTHIAGLEIDCDPVGVR